MSPVRTGTLIAAAVGTATLCVGLWKLNRKEESRQEEINKIARSFVQKQMDPIFQAVALRSKLVISIPEINRMRRLMAEANNITQAQHDIEQTAGMEPRHLKSILFLKQCLEWTQNPSRSQVIQVVENIVAAGSQPADRVELMAALIRFAPGDASRFEVERGRSPQIRETIDSAKTHFSNSKG